MRYDFESNPTVFGKILRGEIPSTKVYEDEQAVVIENIQPKAPIHLLILPKTHLDGLQDAKVGDEALLGHLMLVADKVATKMGFKDKGYRVITNAGAGAGQSVFHLHLHVISGHDTMSGF